MARPQNQKRPRSDEPQPSDRPTKRIKTEASPSNFPPEFWDDLSKVWLTPRALRELDRRRNNQHPRKAATPDVDPIDLRRFARRGGPDLTHLRRVRCPAAQGKFSLLTHEQCSSRGKRTRAMDSRSSATSSRRSRSTKATTVSSRSRRSSAYDDDYEQHLNDHGIYLPFHQHADNRRERPKNLSDVHQRLAEPRTSLSPSRFDESAFEDFQQKHKIKSESTVMRNLIPTIAGSSNIPNDGDLLFTNMESLTSGITVIPKPDFFDGAQASAVCPDVRNELSTLIIPTKHAGVPTVPNFFLEAKAPGGGANVAVRQAGTDGAYGARAMHALQNYGKDEPEYDGNAYAFSSTYHAGTGTLAIHAHHVTAPLTGEERPEYHMNQMKAYAVTSDLESFANGAGAFRNTRDMAQGYRDQFIEEANARARARGLPLVPLPEEVSHEEAEQDNASSHDEFVDYEEPAEYGSQPSHYLSTTYTTEPAFNTPQPLAQYLIEDEPFDSSHAPLADDEDPSLSFTTSLTSSVSTEPSRSKRSRQASSPPSTPRNDAKGKSRVPPNELERAEPNANQSAWVNAYIHKKQICFRNQLNQEIKTHRTEWRAADVENVGSCFYWRSIKSGRVFWTVKLPK